jgi:hypothetical protein
VPDPGDSPAPPGILSGNEEDGQRSRGSVPFVNRGVLGSSGSAPWGGESPGVVASVSICETMSCARRRVCLCGLARLLLSWWLTDSSGGEADGWRALENRRAHPTGARPVLRLFAAQKSCIPVENGYHQRYSSPKPGSSARGRRTLPLAAWHEAPAGEEGMCDASLPYST